MRHSIDSLKAQARRGLEGTVFGAHILKIYRRWQDRQRFQALGAPEEVFTHHYANREWNSDESVSGPGSTLHYTENIRKELPCLVEALGVTRILDAPCGDFNWFKAIHWTREILYLGGDIVPDLITQNQARHGHEQRHFTRLDITKDPLPEADLWLCRDCLFHLSNQDIRMALENFVRSRIPYLLTSTHTSCEVNEDIPTGSFRLLNLTLAPFHLPLPIQEMEDWIEGYPERRLSLWSHDDVARVFQT